MLRLGIILTVTGILALIFGNRGPLPRRTQLIIAIALILLGVPLLVISLLQAK